MSEGKTETTRADLLARGVPPHWFVKPDGTRCQDKEEAMATNPNRKTETTSREDHYVITTPHGFYIDSEACGIDWVFGPQIDATRLTNQEAQRTAKILDRLGISAEVVNYDQG